MSKTLTITWDNVVPAPSCGYKAQFRRSYDPSYTILSTSGSTSGTTTISTIVAAPACFEGSTVSDCCGDTTSIPEAFGINTEMPFGFAVAVVASIPAPTGFAYQITMTSEYTNPYDHLTSGTFDSTTGGGVTVPFQITYPAGSTNYVQLLGAPYPTGGSTISNIIVTAANPIFSQGGSIQQLDPIRTPPYYRLFWDGTTGTTWNGSPMSLPSAVVTNWTVTEINESDEPIAGLLDMSWIYDSLFGNGEVPYQVVRFDVYDGGTNLLGSSLYTPLPLGYRPATTFLQRVSANFPLLPGQQFFITSRWADDTVIDTIDFYFPSP